MSKSNENSPFLVQVGPGDVAASVVLPAMYCRKKHVIKNVAITNLADIAADDTNKVSVKLKNGSTVLAEWDTALTNGDGPLVNGVPAVMPEKEIEVAAGSALTVDVTLSGAAVLTKAAIQLEAYKV